MAQPFYQPTAGNNNQAVVIEREFFGQVEKIDCTYMVTSLMADVPSSVGVIDWIKLLNGVKHFEFDAIVSNINSNYGKVSFLTANLDAQLVVLFKHYLARPREQRLFTLPVWVNRDDTVEVRVNLKRVLSIIQNGLTDGVGNAQDELLVLLRAGKDTPNTGRVTVKGVFRPYKMMDDSQNTRMGIYFEITDLDW